MNVIIVGAGPSGMMAAIKARESGHEVTILEKNDIIGRKLFITGKGRCNVTNACDIEDLLEAVKRNKEFLYSSFYTFSNLDLMEYFEKHGLKLKVERGQRVFPESDKSSDVIKFFRKRMENIGVKVLYGYRVEGINFEKGRIISLKTSRGNIEGDYFIIGTGGGSYPLTGSDGKMLEFIKELGVKTHEFTPSLIPLILREKVRALSGVSLKNVTFRMLSGKKKVFEELGEMLFTLDGISGPLVLSASALWNEKVTSCEIDLKPGLNESELDGRLLRDFASNINKNLENALQGLTLSALIPYILQEAKVDKDKKANSVTREERLNIVKAVKHLEFHIEGKRNLVEAIISRGGVDVSEIDPSTMRLKKYENLSVCGEIIDVDAVTGGFNLQIAFSTGYLAGSSIN